ncbi:MAG: substrate-binding periplasmic protein [Candidatus Binatia bacterium]
MRNFNAPRLPASRTPLVFVVLLLALSFTAGCNQAGTNQAQKESVYDRVMRTGVIRAAYIEYPPALMRLTNSGEFTGIFYEVLVKAAENLDLRVEWTEEVGWGSQIEGLQTDRYDIVGSPVWANPTRGKLTTLSTPVYYSGIGVYTRDDETRFSQDSNWASINSSDVRISTIDGETADLIARSQFPEAQRVSLTQLSDISQMFLEVANNKADVAFAEPYYGYKFLENNPGSIKNIAAAQPIRTLGNCYMFRAGEFQFKHMLDTAIQDLIQSGFVDEVIAKYEPFPNTFYRVNRVYRLVDAE